MNRRSDIVLAFIGAVVLHGIAIYYAARLLAPLKDRISPVLQLGLSSVAITVSPSRQALPVEPVNPSMQTPDSQEPDRSDRTMPRPMPETSRLIETESTTDELDFPLERTAVKRKPDVDAPPRDNDGDLRDKGVRALSPGLGDIRPHYPLGSRLRGEEGVVAVNVKVDGRGAAANVEVAKSSGFKALDKAAITAARKARYVAADGKAPAPGSETTLTFRFRLTD